MRFRFDLVVIWVNVALNVGLLAQSVAAHQWALASLQTLVVVVLFSWSRMMPTLFATLAARKDKALADVDISRHVLAAVERAEESGGDIPIGTVRATH